MAISSICISPSSFFWEKCFMLFQWIPCTVHGTHKHIFSVKFSLKIGHTALFTYLKMILLQCFQFLAINGIQTDPKWNKENNRRLVREWEKENLESAIKWRRISFEPTELKRECWHLSCYQHEEFLVRGFYVFCSCGRYWIFCPLSTLASLVSLLCPATPFVVFCLLAEEGIPKLLVK